VAVDGADAVEVIVVLGDFEHAFVRDVTAAQNVFKEGNHVLALLGSAEADEQERVIFLICHFLLL